MNENLLLIEVWLRDKVSHISNLSYVGWASHPLFAIGVCSGLALLFVLWFVKSRHNLTSQFEKAEHYLRLNKVSKARKKFLGVIKGIDAGQVTADQKRDIECRALLALVGIELSLDNKQEAYDYAERAHLSGYDLPDIVKNLIAECYAEKQESGDGAIDFYIHYLKYRSAKSEATAKIYMVLEKLCRITEEMNSSERRRRAEYNSKVISSIQTLEWAYYYLALSLLLDGKLEDAEREFNHARELNDKQPLTYYWLGVCQLQNPAQNLESAISNIDEFRILAQPNEKNKKREANACSLIAKRLISRCADIGDNETRREEYEAYLQRAVEYYEVAIERDPKASDIHFNLGLAYRLKNDYEKAIESLRQAVLLEPKRVLYAYELGIECAQSGEISEATSLFEQVVELEPEHFEAHGRLGEIYFSQAEYTRTSRHLKIALGLHDAKPNWRMLLLRSLYSEGMYAQIVEEAETFKSAQVSLELGEEVIFCIGRSYSALKFFDKAVVWLSRVSKTLDNLYYLGCAHAHLGQLNHARQCFEKLLQSSNETFRAKAALQLGHIEFHQGNKEKAQQEYRLVAELDPKSWECHYYLGQLALECDDLKQAIIELTEAVSRNNECGKALYLLAFANERNGDYDTALRYYLDIPVGDLMEMSAKLRIGLINYKTRNYKKALEVLHDYEEYNTGNPMLLYFKGASLAALGQYKDALQVWTILSNYHPNNLGLKINIANAHYALGAQDYANGRFRDAIMEWSSYVKDCPHDGSAASNIAILFFKEAFDDLTKNINNSLEKASECFRQALCWQPDNSMYRFYSALCDWQLCGDREEFVATLKLLLENEPNNPRFQYHLGLCLMDKDEPQKAIETFRKVIGEPDDGGYWRYASWALANILMDEGNHQEAGEILLPAITPVNESHH